MTEAVVAKYSEDEPRDERGEWTTGGAVGLGYFAKRGINVNLTGVAPEYRNGILQTLREFDDRFPSAAKGLSLRVGDVGENYAQTTSSFSARTPSIVLSPKWFGEGARWHNDSLGSMPWMVDESPQGLIVHELGHVLDNKLGDGVIGYSRGDPIFSYAPTEAHPYWDGPSSYGARSRPEAFAEAFAAWWKGTTPDNPQVVAVAQRIDLEYPSTATKFDPSEPRDEAGRWTSDGAAPVLDRLGFETVVPGARLKPDGILPEYLPAIRSTLSEFAQRFPEIAGKAGGVKVFVGKTTPGSQAETYGNSIRLSPVWWKLGPSSWSDAPGWTVDPSPQGVLIHELGHVVDEGGGKAESGSISWPPSVGVLRELRDEPGSYLTGYAKTSTSESFAEAFTAWWEGSHADNPQVQAVAGYLSQRYGVTKIEKARGSPLTFSTQALQLLRQAAAEAYASGYNDAGDGQWADIQDGAAEDATAGTVDGWGSSLMRLAALLVGGAITEALLGSRLDNYTAGLYGAYNEGFGASVTDNVPDATVEWVAQGDNNTCDPCDERDGETWPIDGDYPYPGSGRFGSEECRGGPRCRCELVYHLPEGDQTDTQTDTGDVALAAGVDLTTFTVTELTSLRALLAKYSPDQPRDADGRFAYSNDPDYPRPEGITPDENDAVTRWVHSYDDMHAMQADPTGSRAVNLASALAKCPPVNGTIYRGMQAAAPTFQGNVDFFKERIGQTLRFTKPYSTSPTIQVATAYAEPILLKITPQDGAARDITWKMEELGYAKYAEAILAPGRFRVDGVEVQKLQDSFSQRTKSDTVVVSLTDVTKGDRQWTSVTP